MKRYLSTLAILCSLSAQAQYTLVKDINTGAAHSDPTQLTVFNNKLYFNAYTDSNGRELWVHDGTNTTMVKDLNMGLANGSKLINYFSAAPILDGKMYFQGDDGGSGWEPYSYNGSGAPVLAANIDSGSGHSLPTSIIAYGSRLYFYAFKTGYGDELWSFQPSTNTLQRLTDLYNGGQSGIYDPDVNVPVAWNGKIYFAGTDATHGEELFAFDTATQQTTLVYEFEPNLVEGAPRNFIAGGSKLYFSAYTTDYNRELYSYDGVNAPVRLTDVNSFTGKGVYETSMCWFQGALIFAGNNGVHGFELFRFDTTTQLATMVKDLYPGSYSSGPLGFTIYNNQLYFSATHPQEGYELWVWNGTGTPTLAAAFGQGALNGYPVCLTVWNNYLYLNAFTVLTGYELFRYSDVNVSVEKIAVSEDHVYPNPAKDKLFFDLNTKAAEIQVSDISGRIVLRSAASAGSADVASLQPGIYMYKLMSEAGVTHCGKFMKE